MTEAFGVDPKVGLNSTDVVKRRTRYGGNTLQSIRPRAPWRILLEQFASLVIALLASAAIVALVTGDVVDAVAILAVLVFVTNTSVCFSSPFRTDSVCRTNFGAFQLTYSIPVQVN